MDGALRHTLPNSAQLHSVFTHQQELEVMSDLTLSVALKIIDGAVAKARSAKYKPMGIAVLDASGHLVAYAREDGASMFRFEIAQAKAWGAIGMGVSSRVLGQRANNRKTVASNTAYANKLSAFDETIYITAWVVHQVFSLLTIKVITSKSRGQIILTLIKSRANNPPKTSVLKLLRWQTVAITRNTDLR